MEEIGQLAVMGVVSKFFTIRCKLEDILRNKLNHKQRRLVHVNLEEQVWSKLKEPRNQIWSKIKYEQH